MDKFTCCLFLKTWMRALLMGLEMTIGEMNAMGNPVHHATIEARDALKG